MISLEKIGIKLNEKGLKSTHQRLVVYQALLQYKGHPSAEEIYDIVKINNPTISLGTIYKTLETFVENDLVIKVSTTSGKMKYDSTLESHNHIYSTNTDEIIDYFDAELKSIIDDYIKSKQIENFNIRDVRLHIRGNKIDPKKHISIK